MRNSLAVSLLGLGVCAGAVGIYGAFEQTKALEGGAVTYLTVGAPLVALAAALLPPFAEKLWQRGHRLKSVLLWLALVPAAGYVALASTERVHDLKATASASRSALAATAERARGDLHAAKEALSKAEPGEAKALARKASGKTLGTESRTALATAEQARAKVAKAEAALKAADAQATKEAALAPPAWLLPASLDLVAFLLIWSGLTAWEGSGIKSASKQNTRKRRKPKEKKSAKAKAGTVIPFKAA